MSSQLAGWQMVWAADSFAMLKSVRICSGVFPLIMLATVLQPTSLNSQLILYMLASISTDSNGLISR